MNLIIVIVLVIISGLSTTITGVQAQDEAVPQPSQEFEEVIAEPIVVSATRTERSLANLPVSATVVTRQDVKDAPAIGTDDILRTVPGIN
ncbi:hypothetical protein, partial [Nitrospira sp. BLG_2]|uniref:hypothetical protein n=1 Tax=Nitrospira sp. BLG_2 TaxID=3397507 RepID=UPI003B99E7F7